MYVAEVEVKPFNADSLNMIDDFVSLPELQEGVILHLLQARYEQDHIYVCSLL
jgi:myosin heavy subunit